jgi:hypothetical protein
VRRNLAIKLEETLKNGVAFSGNVFFDDADGRKHNERIALMGRWV